MRNIEKIKVLLLEGVDKSALESFNSFGFKNVEYLESALPKQELIKKLSDTVILGIRSRTSIDNKILSMAPNLLAIGCYCIGTNQVSVQEAALLGIPVFNAPHSNTRSVAELVIGLTIMLLRDIFPKNMAAHKGLWQKSAKDSHEVRGKVIGIIGYGHIGSQVSILAESLGMKVYYYDIVTKLPLGNARSAKSIEELVAISDVITLHVPETPQTNNMINGKLLKKAKKGACLINASRGSVVDIESLVKELDKKRIKACALDVFPTEPESKKSKFESSLRGRDNVILTPHIGGSTIEAQKNIGLEVSNKLIAYTLRGSTDGAVNFPSLNLPKHIGTHRIIHIHKNVPGMLQKVNSIIAKENINVQSQYLLTNADIGYVVVDIEKKASENLREALNLIKGTIKTRVLY